MRRSASTHIRRYQNRVFCARSERPFACCANGARRFSSAPIGRTARRFSAARKVVSRARSGARSGVQKERADARAGDAPKCAAARHDIGRRQPKPVAPAAANAARMRAQGRRARAIFLAARSLIKSAFYLQCIDSSRKISRGRFRRMLILDVRARTKRARNAQHRTRRRTKAASSAVPRMAAEGAPGCCLRRARGTIEVSGSGFLCTLEHATKALRDGFRVCRHAQKSMLKTAVMKQKKPLQKCGRRQKSSVLFAARGGLRARHLAPQKYFSRDDVQRRIKRWEFSTIEHSDAHHARAAKKNAARKLNSRAALTARLATLRFVYSQFSAPPVWYSVTRVSKKLRSFFRSIISLIQGKGFSSWANRVSRPICCARRLAMKRR